MTARGYIYVIGSFEHFMHVKVGLSGSPVHTARLSQLQTGNPFSLHVWAEFAVTRGSLRECEQFVHRNIDEFAFKNEWFKRHPRDMVSHVESLVREYNTIK